MGLDTVELVLAIEKQFGVEIPDEVYEHLTTVGRMSEWLAAELSRQRGRPHDRFAVYDELRPIIAQVLHVPENHVPENEVAWDAEFVRDLGAG